MPEIRENNDVVTQITTVKVPPQHQAEVLRLMAERARFMATHRNKLAAAHHSPEFRKKWPRFGELVNEAEPCLYEVAHVEAA
jgi:hypothetical protein